ncbi:hypothetical protein NDU88_001806 [Pleurodeles waltl]|uniref:Uncharacterized protein n=1 Tax=Pleurodeles waltl TaxID=8319 RepID=A0AAV7MMR7_PLEWA|nr:hypothetical protein NDU88_001806 [Pleurodeles waltl]
MSRGCCPDDPGLRTLLSSYRVGESPLRLWHLLPRKRRGPRLVLAARSRHVRPLCHRSQVPPAPLGAVLPKSSVSISGRRARYLPLGGHRTVLCSAPSSPLRRLPTPPRPRRRHDSGPTQQVLHLPAALRCLQRFVTGAPLQFFLLAPAEAAVQTNFV